MPDEPTVRLWREQLDAAIQTGRFNPELDTLVLDGIPRNLHQAEMLNDTLTVRGVFNLSCEDSEKLIHRLQRRAQMIWRPLLQIFILHLRLRQQQLMLRRQRQIVWRVQIFEHLLRHAAKHWS